MNSQKSKRKHGNHITGTVRIPLSNYNRVADWTLSLLSFTLTFNIIRIRVLKIYSLLMTLESCSHQWFHPIDHQQIRELIFYLLGIFEFAEFIKKVYDSFIQEE
jgi:hypothetical protein